MVHGQNYWQANLSLPRAPATLPHRPQTSQPVPDIQQVQSVLTFLREGHQRQGNNGNVIPSQSNDEESPMAQAQTDISLSPPGLEACGFGYFSQPTQKLAFNWTLKNSHVEYARKP